MEGGNTPSEIAPEVHASSATSSKHGPQEGQEDALMVKVNHRGRQ